MTPRIGLGLAPVLFGWGKRTSTVNLCRSCWLLGFILSCAAGDPTLGSDWSLNNPLPQTCTLHSAWGTGPNDVFIVGGAGTILRFNGTCWYAMPSGTSDALRSVWGTGLSNILVVGEAGTILHYDGALSWSPMASGTTQNLYDVWGSSPSDAFAVGDRVILHYDGTSWSSIAVDYMLHGVWGTAPDDVYAVGPDGTVLHYDGSVWTAMASGTTDDVTAVWGSGANNVFATTRYGDTIGHVLHFDGTEWSGVYGGQEGLRDIWGSGPGDVFAVGDAGTIMHFDGVDWTETPDVTTRKLYGVWGSSADDVFAVGEWTEIQHYDGSAWTRISSELTYANLEDVWGSGPNDVFAVGESGTILRYDGSFWSKMATGFTENCLSIWGLGPNDVLVGCDGGKVLSYDGSSWSVTNTPTAIGLLDIWYSGSSDGFAVDGSRFLQFYDGSSWSSQVINGDATLQCVWGSGPNDVYVGGTFFEDNSFPHQDWWYAVVYHYDGSTWTEAVTGGKTSEAWLPHYSAIWGSAPNDVWAVGWSPSYGDLLSHYDGTSWTHSSMLWAPLPSYVWGSGPNDVYVAARYSADLYNYDGTLWFHVPTESGHWVNAVWGSGPNDVYAVGNEGAILHYPAQYLLQVAVYDSALGQVDVSPNRLHYDENAPVVLTAAPEPGWAFQRWHWDVPTGHEFDNPLTVTMDGDKMIMAVFGPAYTLDLTVADSPWGTVEVMPDREYYTVGTNVTLEATPHEYGNFVEWQGDVPGGTSTENPLTIAMDSDKEITAVFVRDHSLAVTIAEPGWGTVDLDPNLPYYADGMNVTLEAEPNDYRNFVEWQGDVPGGSSTDNPLTILMHGDKEITAVFEWPVYTLQLKEINGMWGLTFVEPYLPGYEYQAGAEIVLTAIPEGGKEFTHWILYDPNYPGDGNYATYDANTVITILMMDDRKVTAVYACGSGMGPFLPMVLCALVLAVWVGRRR